MKRNIFIFLKISDRPFVDQRLLYNKNTFMVQGGIEGARKNRYRKI